MLYSGEVSWLSLPESLRQSAYLAESAEAAARSRNSRSELLARAVEVSRAVCVVVGASLGETALAVGRERARRRGPSVRAETGRRMTGRLSRGELSRNGLKESKRRQGNEAGFGESWRRSESQNRGCVPGSGNAARGRAEAVVALRAGGAGSAGDAAEVVARLDLERASRADRGGRVSLGASAEASSRRDEASAERLVCIANQ